MNPGRRIPPQDETLSLTFKELSRQIGVEAEQILAMIDEGILEPATGSHMTTWRFSADSACRAATAVRLQQDLRINLAGAALALELLDEISSLRDRVQALEQLLFKDWEG